MVFSHKYEFTFIFSCFYHQYVMVCFIDNLLQWVVVSLTINFFIGFRIDNLDVKVQSNKVIKSNHLR